MGLVGVGGLDEAHLGGVAREREPWEREMRLRGFRWVGVGWCKLV